MAEGKKIYNYIERYAEEKGIITLDVGTLKESTEEWVPVQHICDPRFEPLHKLVSDCYVKANKFKGKQPINYLYRFWKDSNSSDEVIVYSFSSSGYVRAGSWTKVPSTPKYNIVGDNSWVSVSQSELCDIKDNLIKYIEESPETPRSFENTEDEFKFYQGIFTKMVLLAYNQIIDKTEEKINYVTIVLLRKFYDNKWHLSYNAVIFSNNLNYLDSPSIRLLYDCISHENYDNEIAALKHKALRESIKSAIAAIMARNMSHNLGSHYLYYTKKHLERLADELSNEQSPDIRGAARVLGYTQARMDYLATIISNDKYPYGSVNFKSQIFDELTYDDFSKRHFIGDSKKNSRTVNYLLSYLIRSEDFTRPSIMTDGGLNPDNLDLLYLQIRYSADCKNYKVFTGTNFMLPEAVDPADYPDVATLASEAGIKYILSNIELALPGGNMSCHAFFNIVENFIRNSAKYLREDFHKEDGHSEKSLTTNIVLRYKDSEHKFIEIVLYDNKENATYYKLLKRTSQLNARIQDTNCGINSFFKGEPNVEYIRTIGPSIVHQLEESLIVDKDILLREAKSIVRSWQKECLYEQIMRRLGSIRVLDENNALDKENKGLKEMLFSAAWMRSYSFPAEKSYTDIIFDIQNEKDVSKKLGLIKEYCFSPVMVLEDDETLKILPEDLSDNHPDDGLSDVLFKPACFGLSFTLPLFKKTVELDIVNDESKMIHNCLNTYSDIIKADLSVDCPLNLRKVFTRIYPIDLCEGKTEAQIFREILRQRFTGFDDYWLSFGKRMETCGVHDDAHHIKFDHHMKEHVQESGGLESQLVYAYSDSVSGGNFTKTMNELFDTALGQGGEYRSETDEFFVLKIKESALTRVTIIDERLSDTMEKNGSDLELTLKNIRLLNYRDTDDIKSFTDLFKGNSFKDNKDTTNFLSIHLGLVEKIIQSTEFSNFVGEIPVPQKAEMFMSLLRESFGGENVFISIHSGRGNFSAELEGPLAGYPFITMSSLESAFNNSKFLLTQLFYNTLYVGKGKINNHSKA